MPVETKRKRGETFESFLRRFNKRLMHSGVILESKKKKYIHKKLSRNLQKKVAIERKKYREQYEYMRKTGRLKEEPKGRSGNNRGGQR